MAQTTRTFLAIDVTTSIADRLSKLQSKLAMVAPGFRWTVAPPFHLTLAFLGDVPYTDLNEVCEAASRTARSCKRFEIQVAGIGAFPKPERPRVAWVGIDGPGVEPLAALHKRLVADLRRIGRSPEDARFNPHITIGRIGSGRRGKAPAQAVDLTEVVAAHQKWNAGSFTVGELVVYSSTLTPEGSVYAPLARGHLASARSRTET